MIEKPIELEQAELILDLADRFHTVPSVIMQEEAEIMRLLKIYELGHIKPEGGEDYA